MSTYVALEQLLDYSDHERTKWAAWFATDPGRLVMQFQPVGRYPTIGSVLEHVFFVERRHLSRLQGATPPDATGIPAGDLTALFEYGALVRADFRSYLAALDGEHAQDILTVTVASGSFAMSQHKLATHIVLHEIRHCAQMAYAVRISGHEPPGQHDLFYFPGFS